MDSLFLRKNNGNTENATIPIYGNPSTKTELAKAYKIKAIMNVYNKLSLYS